MTIAAEFRWVTTYRTTAEAHVHLGISACICAKVIGATVFPDQRMDRIRPNCIDQLHRILHEETV